MRLPEDFWSTNDDEPGAGGVFVAFLILMLCLAALFGGAIVWAASLPLR